MTDAAPLLSALTARRDERRVPALSAAVAGGGRIRWAGAAGDAAPGRAADADVAFRIGSISKPMTAVAVLRLVADGRVGLNDPVGRHVPDAPVPDASVAQLLTHTSGLAAEPPGPWWERNGSGPWAELVASCPARLWEPGERFHYSNVGYAVLGRLVAEAHGRPWDEVLRREVWEPLGMTRTGRTAPEGAATGYAVHPHADVVLAEPVAGYGAMGPAGEVWSTPSDLVRFGTWLAGAGAADDDTRVLPLAWRRRMVVPRVVADETGGPFARAWGLGVSLRHPAPLAGDGPGRQRHRTAGHGGSVPGFTAELRVDLTSGVAVAVCGSSTAGFGDVTFLLDAWGDAADDGSQEDTDDKAPLPLVAPSSGRRVARDASESDAHGLTGTWYWGPMAFEVSLAGGLLQLRAQDDGGRGTAFAPEPTRSGEWVGVDGGYWLGERLRLVPPTTGDPGLALDVGTFHLTRAPYDPRTSVPGGTDARGWQPAALLGLRGVRR